MHVVYYLCPANGDLSVSFYEIDMSKHPTMGLKEAFHSHINMSILGWFVYNPEVDKNKDVWWDRRSEQSNIPRPIGLRQEAYVCYDIFKNYFSESKEGWDLLNGAKKKQRLSFESDFMVLTPYTDNKGHSRVLLSSKAPFNASTAWAATKLASGDAT